MEILDIVDDADKVVAQATKREAHEKKLTHRIVHVLVFNSRGEMLLQFRSKNKRFMPYFWSTSVGGHVTSGETYEQAAAREMKEEIGIEARLEPLFYDAYTQWDGMKMFLSTFKAVHNGPFRPDPGEVESVSFFPMGKIKEMAAKGEKLHPELLFLLREHYGF